MQLGKLMLYRLSYTRMTLTITFAARFATGLVRVSRS
jgi:hypothetical protein